MNTRIELGCPENSPQGGYRKTYLEIPTEQPPEASISSPEAMVLEMQVNDSIGGIEGYRLVTEEPDGSIVQEFCLAPDVAYELFLKFQEIDRDAFQS